MGPHMLFASTAAPRLNLLLAASLFAATPSLFAQAGVPAALHPVQGYAQLPLSFEANQGQADRQIRFLSRGDRYGLFLTDNTAVLTLTKGNQLCSGQRFSRAAHPPTLLPTHSRASALEATSKLTVPAPCPTHTAAPTGTLRLQLTHANPSISATATELLPGTASYFTGKDPANWHADIPTYARVEYKSVYPGIDLAYYGNQGHLEYDFIVGPGASPKPIALHFAGAKHLALNQAGDLTVTTSTGSVAFEKPILYQLTGAHQREQVKGNFQLLANNTITFQVGPYDHTRTLVIDPVLAYSTYLDTQAGFGDFIAVDSAGSAYIASGVSFSNGFRRNFGPCNISVTRLNPAGNARLYSVCLGGSVVEGDSALGIAIDHAGNAYVTGFTYSTDFPVTPHAYQSGNNIPQTSNPAANAFVTKLNPSGSALVYSTYLGGSGFNDGSENQTITGDLANAIAVDATGSAYVAGTASSLDFPVTSGAFQQTNNASQVNGTPLTGFITRLNPSGSALVYSTYLGGSLNDSAAAIAISPAGNAFVTGSTSSTDFPVSATAFQKHNRANSDFLFNAFVTQLNPAGSALAYSTYLGGTFYAAGSGIAIDPSGNAFINGVTDARDFPVTSNAFQKQNHAQGNGGQAAFVSKLNSTGSALVYSTYLGGNGFGAESNAIALDTAGDAAVTGIAFSTDFPVTPDAFQKVNTAVSSPTGTQSYFSLLNPSGSGLVYSTYFDGTYGGDSTGIAYDPSGNLYLAGVSLSRDFPITSKALGGYTNDNSFVAKFTFDSTLVPTSLTLTATQSPAGVLTVTAHVQPLHGSAIPTGSITGNAYGSPYVTVPLDSQGNATYSTSALPPGATGIIATYSGDPTHAPTSAGIPILLHSPSTK